MVPALHDDAREWARGLELVQLHEALVESQHRLETMSLRRMVIVDEAEGSIERPGTDQFIDNLQSDVVDISALSGRVQSLTIGSGNGSSTTPQIASRASYRTQGITPHHPRLSRAADITYFLLTEVAFFFVLRLCAEIVGRLYIYFYWFEMSPMEIYEAHYNRDFWLMVVTWMFPFVRFLALLVFGFERLVELAVLSESIVAVSVSCGSDIGVS